MMQKEKKLLLNKKIMKEDKKWTSLHEKNSRKG